MTAATEQKRQDSSVRRAAKCGRMTKVTRIRGPIQTHPNILAHSSDDLGTRHLIRWQNQAKFPSNGRPLGECRVRVVDAGKDSMKKGSAYVPTYQLKGQTHRESRSGQAEQAIQALSWSSI
jgi:hypothetical protein